MNRLSNMHQNQSGHIVFTGDDSLSFISDINHNFNAIVVYLLIGF